MSRLGKKPINIPQDVEVKLENNILKIKGPKGEEQVNVPQDFDILLDSGLIKITPNFSRRMKQKQLFEQWGTIRSLIQNAVIGVKDGFAKKLEVNGVGYKAEKDNDNLVLKIGYSHPVVLKIPEGLDVSIEKNIITVSGISKEKVGLFAALIKRQKPVEPYQGKGIKYQGEYVRRKVGKKMASTSG